MTMRGPFKRQGVHRFVLFFCLITFVLWFGGTAAWNTRKTQLRYQCAENMIRIGSAVSAYESRYQSSPPTLDVLTTSELINDASLVCPAARARNYEYSMKSKGLGDHIWLTEPLTNHRDGANMLLGDGRCKFVSPQEFDVLNKTP